MAAAPPTVYDTHCDGAGLLPSTGCWSPRYINFRKYTSDIYADLEFPDYKLADYDCTGKTVIISGSNSGIGKEAAIYFAQAGATVVMACRMTARHEQHPDEARKDIVRSAGVKESMVELWEIDCSSLANVESFAKKWLDTGRTVDILVNNAGLSAGARVITEEGFELTRAINFLSHCLLTLYLLPALAQSRAPRVINTCSIFHSGGVLDFADMDNEKRTSLGAHGVQAYCNSKLWFLMWSVELQERLSRSADPSLRHIIVHGVHPGFVGSNIWNLTHWPRPAVTAFQFVMKKLSISSKQGSYVIIHASLDPCLGLPKQLTEKGNKKPEPGESAKWGGKFINRNMVDIRRPEVDDVLARSRLWQRVLEDVKAEKRGLTKGLPDHLESVKLVGRETK